MNLEKVDCERKGDEFCLVGIVRRAGSRKEIRVEYLFPARHEPFVFPSADAFVPLLLLPAMTEGEDLEIDPPVSPLLLQALRDIQHIFATWYIDLGVIDIHGTPREEPQPARGASTGLFFSGGVDSFYTLLKNLRGRPTNHPEISHLIFLDGYENPLERYTAHAETLRSVEEVATAYGKDSIVVRTNARTHFPVSWGPRYHGSVLGGAALSLSSGLSDVFIASSFSYQYIRAWGSHPLLDPMWSTERTRIIHDGCEARRIDKIMGFIADDPIALKHLRVCLDRRGRADNCGRCRKCVRTMVTLALLGKLDQAAKFPKQFPEKFETRMPRRLLNKEKSSIHIEVRNSLLNLEVCRAVPNPDPRIARFLRNVVRLGRRRLFWMDLRTTLADLFRTPRDFNTRPPLGLWKKTPPQSPPGCGVHDPESP